jgi:predicted ATPase
MLGATLRPLSLLLVLDNAEHLRDDVAAFALALHASAPRLALLVTSQEPLALADEQVLRLDGLALPPSDDPAALRASPAVALFLARVRAAQATPSVSTSGPGRGPTPGTAPGATAVAGDDAAIDGAALAALAEICRRLDGIPLALELAAARVPLLGVAGVLDKLGEPLALLTRGARRELGAPPRQQTLRAALQWSHALLDAPQKVVFRRLAVFTGSFTLEAAQRVAGDDDLDDWSVLDHLEALLAKSLLQVVQVVGDGDRRRFRLLETARRFALERLRDAGEVERSWRRHAEAMCALFEAADERFAATPTLPWLRGLLPELPNLRAAVQWALGPEGDEPLAIALCAAAGSFWALADMAAESGPPLRRLAARVDERVPLATRARFWLAVANRGADAAFSWRETYEASERAVALAREGGQDKMLHRALAHRLPLAQRVGVVIDAAATAAEMRALEGADWNALQRRPRRAAEAYAWFQQGDWERFGELERAELARLNDAGDRYRAWFVAHRLALAETALGHADAAVAVMERAVEEIRAEGWLRPCWQQVAMLAMAWIETGRAPTAKVHEAVRLMQGAGAMAWMACHLAEWLTQRERFADAARLLGWLARRHAERGETPSGHGERARERALTALRLSADEARIAAWRVEGESWADDDVAQAMLAVREANGAAG